MAMPSTDAAVSRASSPDTTGGGEVDGVVPAQGMLFSELPGRPSKVGIDLHDVELVAPRLPFAREDLDAWERRLGRPLTNGFLGENLTTHDLDVNGALLGERWRIGDDVELTVTFARIPCSTFRGWVGEPRWLQTFTTVACPGTYLRVLSPRIR